MNFDSLERAEFVLIFSLLIGLSQQAPNSPRSVPRQSFSDSVQYEFSDGNHLDVWIHEPFTPGVVPVNSSCVQLDLTDRRNGKQNIRLFFDGDRNLQQCQYKPIDIGRRVACKLEGVPRPRHKINIQEFKLDSTSELHEKCQELVKQPGSGRLTRRKRSNPFIMPGTRWCGKGNSATREHMFGEEIEADRCCYAHDHCFENIPSLTRKYGYYNISPVTLSNCLCDDEFLECLEHAGTQAANRVGSIYFNVFKIPCFKHTTRTVCTNRSKDDGTCLEYAHKDNIELFHAQRYTVPYDH